MDARFQRLQERLGEALAANRPDSNVDHVLIALPSYSVSESILSHYGDRIPSLEHRYLPAMLIPGRIPSCEFVFVSTRRPAPDVVAYYRSLWPPEQRPAIEPRVHVIEADDGTPRSVAARLIDRPDLIGRIRSLIGSRPALIEPWVVTEHEVALALALDVPINGSDPALRPVGFKSAGRRLFADVGVPVPVGVEDVRTADDVVEAVLAIRAANPNVPGVVIKHDDSGAGDGNAVIDLRAMDAAPDPGRWLRDRIDALPDWYRTDLLRGGVVEELVAGERFSSPSAQVDIRPGGDVVVLATHEQVLGGPDGQVYLGCTFPANPAYAPELAVHAGRIGRALAERGALGRIAVDFVAVASDDQWRVFAIEINLRKGGTTHPYAVLRNLVPGRYDPATGRWVASDGTARTYSATDNLVDPAWLGLEPRDVIRVVAEAGTHFDPRTGVGVVLHMLSGLAIDGRLGLTAIGRDPTESGALLAATREAIDSLAGTRDRLAT